MATIFTHPVIAITLMPWFRDVRQSKKVLLTGIVLTVLPDIDVVTFSLGISYEHIFGHRGFTHSLFFSLIVSGFFAQLFSKNNASRVLPIWIFLFLSMASHGVLDALTNGGLGVAFFSPFSNERYFFPFQPIEVSTLNIKYFFAEQGSMVLKNELKWIWAPALILLLIGLKWFGKGDNS